MSNQLFWLAFSIIQMANLLFCFFVILRVRSYVRVYKFEETKNTLLFGFIPIHRLWHFYFIYLVGFIITTALIFQNLIYSA